jgi:hypothetical protein
MKYIPFGYDQGDGEAWEEPIRLGKAFLVFVVIVVTIWSLGAIVLAVKDPIPRWGMIEDK